MTNMHYLPISFNVADKIVAFAGGEGEASAKVRLLAKTKARILVIADSLNKDLQYYHQNGRIDWVQDTLTVKNMPVHLKNVTIFYAATGDKKNDAMLASHAKKYVTLVNAVDQQSKSDFITPALINHAPLTIAISTEGTAPVLARLLKGKIETLVPKSMGMMAQFAGAFRPKIEKSLPTVQARRHFWQWFFEKKNDTPTAIPEHIINEYQQALASGEAVSTHNLYFLPIDNMLDERSLNILRHAEKIYYHQHPNCNRLIEMARREADFFPNQLPEIDDLISEEKSHNIVVIAPMENLPQLLARADSAKITIDYLGRNNDFYLHLRNKNDFNIINWQSLIAQNHLLELNLSRDLLTDLQAKLLHYQPINDGALYHIHKQKLQPISVKDLHLLPKTTTMLLLDFTPQSKHMELSHAQNF